MKKIIILTLLFFVLVPLSYADTQLPPPEIMTECSQNNQYCVTSNPDNNTTVVSNEIGEVLWIIEGWNRILKMANDGTLVILHLELLPIDYTPDDKLISFYKDGILIDDIILNEVISSLDKIEPTISNYHWGSYVDVDSNNGAVTVSTVEYKKIIFYPSGKTEITVDIRNIIGDFGTKILIGIILLVLIIWGLIFFLRKKGTKE